MLFVYLLSTNVVGESVVRDWKDNIPDVDWYNVSHKMFTLK